MGYLFLLKFLFILFFSKFFHILLLEDILSNNDQPWIVKKIDLNGITVQKENTESAENLNENGNLVDLEKYIDVNNPTINLTEINLN